MLKRILFLMLCVIPSFAIAQNIEGKVINEDKDLLQGVAIVLLNEDGENITGTMTDVDGAFVLKDVADGKYVLKFVYLGFEEKIEKVEVKGEPVILGSITLVKEKEEPQEVEEIEEVEIE